ncbi:MAG TPA: hypothetical protein VJN44_12170 [Roseateles sp.]|nr:hypothetical protein [Roseateles sp.]
MKLIAAAPVAATSRLQRTAALLLLALAALAAAPRPALAQGGAGEMWTRSNALAARERLYGEVRQARADGAIKPFWGSPNLIELPLRPRGLPQAAALAEPPQLLRPRAELRAAAE